jgi:hypothetical protein
MKKHKIPKATPEDIERLERESKRYKRERRKPYPDLGEDFDYDDRKQIKRDLGYSRVGMWGRR